MFVCMDVGQINIGLWLNPKLCLCAWLLGRAQFKTWGVKKNLKQPSPIHAHVQHTGHNTTESSFNIIGRENQGLPRTIKESIYIKVNNPTLNQNIAKYNFSHIWDRVPFNTPGIKLGSSQQPSEQT